MTSLPDELRAKLDARQATGTALHLFFRDDDVDEDEASLRRLLELLLPRSIPVCLGVIPGRLTQEGSNLLRDYCRLYPNLLELAQHGWLHVNHEKTGRKCEFGPSRSFAEQFADISAGQARMTAAFGEASSPVFIPPWNRCTTETCEALDRLGFRFLSKLRGAEPVAGYRFRELSVSLDLYRWRAGAALKAPAEIYGELLAQLERPAPVGLMLHHKVMDEAAFAFIEPLLKSFEPYSIVRYHSLRTLGRALETAGEAER